MIKSYTTEAIIEEIGDPYEHAEKIMQECIASGTEAYPENRGHAYAYALGSFKVQFAEALQRMITAHYAEECRR
jgi:hypothetical protein